MIPGVVAAQGAYAFDPGPIYSGPWNPADTSADIDVSEDLIRLTRLTTNPSAWRTARSTEDRGRGKWYAEFINVANGSVNGAMMVGLCPSSLSLSAYVGSSGNSFSLQANNTTNLLSYNNAATTTVVAGGTASLAVGERMMLAVDFDAGRLWFGTKGVWRNGDPAAGTGANYTFTPNLRLHLGASLFRSPQVVDAVLPPDHLYSPPAGFEPWIGGTEPPPPPEPVEVLPSSFSQSSVYGAGLAATPSNMRDETYTTGAGTTIGGTQWIEADMGAAVEAVRVVVAGGTLSGWGGVAAYLNGARLEYYDGSGWQTITTVSGASDSAGIQEAVINFSPVTAQRFRLAREGYLATTEFRLYAPGE